MLKDVFTRKSYVTFFPQKMLPFVFGNLICFGTFWVVTVVRVFRQLWQAGAALRLQWLLLPQSTSSRARGLQQLRLPGSGAHAQQLWHTS